MQEVKWVQSCDLRVCDSKWDFGGEHKQEIDASWTQARAGNPAYFNGTIFLLASCSLEGEHFRGDLFKTDFKSFLYWRDNGYAEAGVRDAFGSGVIRSCEGHVILGRQAAGHVNAGLAYTPGGFIDERDVLSDGRIDIVGSVARELREETGLKVEDLVREPGFYLTFFNSQISMAVGYRSVLTSRELARRISQHILNESNPELEGVVVVKDPPRDNLVGFAPYVVPLLNSVLSSPCEKDT